MELQATYFSIVRSSVSVLRHCYPLWKFWRCKDFLNYYCL